MTSTAHPYRIARLRPEHRLLDRARAWFKTRTHTSTEGAPVDHFGAAIEATFRPRPRAAKQAAIVDVLPLLDAYLTEHRRVTGLLTNRPAAS